MISKFIIRISITITIKCGYETQYGLSIIFNVSFLSLTRFKDSVKSSQNSRIYHILNIAELKDRLVNHDHDYKNLTISEDRWRITNEKIEAYREKSIDWLKNALHGFID